MLSGDEAWAAQVTVAPLPLHSGESDHPAEVHADKNVSVTHASHEVCSESSLAIAGGLTNRASAAGRPAYRAHNSCLTASSTAQRPSPDGPAAAGAS